MFELRRCSAAGCDATALSGAEFCAAHHPELKAYADAAVESMSASSVVKSLNYSGLRIEGADLSMKRFYACSFTGAVLRNVRLSGCVFRMCFFDFCSADSCDLSGIDAQFCSFAGSRFLNVSFEHSELVHNNFNGSNSTDCTFNYSNLYNSRFIMAEFEKTDFIDCNLKRAIIIPAKESEVSWRLSNTQEAIREIDRIDA